MSFGGVVVESDQSLGLDVLLLLLARHDDDQRACDQVQVATALVLLNVRFVREILHQHAHTYSGQYARQNHA